MRNVVIPSIELLINFYSSNSATERKILLKNFPNNSNMNGAIETSQAHMKIEIALSFLSASALNGSNE